MAGSSYCDDEHGIWCNILVNLESCPSKAGQVCLGRKKQAVIRWHSCNYLGTKELSLNPKKCYNSQDCMFAAGADTGIVDMGLNFLVPITDLRPYC